MRPQRNVRFGSEDDINECHGRVRFNRESGHGTGGETCSTPADYGKNRYNPATGHMQACVPR